MISIIGIDPGKQGAIVQISPNGEITKVVMPLIGKELDMHSLNLIIHQCHGTDVHVFIEDVHAIFGSAAGATFTFGFVCGAIQMGVTAHKVPFTLVQPKKWQREIYQGIPEIRRPTIIIKKGKRIGKSMKGKLDCKSMSLMAAKRLFPDFDLRKDTACKVAHDGIVDALLIAEFGRRQMKGNPL